MTAWKFGQSVLQHQKRIETEPDGKKKEKAGVFQPSYLECLKKFSQLTEIKWQRKDFRLISGGKSLERKQGDMSNFGDKVQPAVKETKNVAIYTVVGVVVMWVGFLILHLIWPEKIPI